MKINKGDWVVITTKDPKTYNVSDNMKLLHGMVLQLPSHDGDSFEMVKGNGTWHWVSFQKHFRRAEPHEIPGYKQENNYEIY